MHSIQNIAGYRFITLTALGDLQSTLRVLCVERQLKGTILLSEEGININLAGREENISAFKTFLNQDARFAGMNFHVTYSDSLPFRQLKIKVKKEIITLRQPEVSVTCGRAPSIAPETLKQWLDEKKEITLLDTRNDFEVQFGTFNGAINPDIDKFGELPALLDTVPKSQPIVMFCTGGIRCEKAAIYFINHGFSEVYQLDGGILGYFAKVGGDHYAGECFVFDERVTVNPSSF